MIITKLKEWFWPILVGAAMAQVFIILPAGSIAIQKNQHFIMDHQLDTYKHLGNVVEAIKLNCH